MPVYEGIGLINEKNPVVLEIGKNLTKVGFAGEGCPRCIIPSAVGSKEGGGTLRRLQDFKDETDLYQMLVEFLHRLYCRYLLVTPKDRKVVVVESVFTTTVWRKTLARVLYLHYEVLTVLWVPSSLAAVSSTNQDTALVVDFGSDEIQITPVCKGVTILNAVECHELGATTFDKNLKSILMENCLTPGKEIESILSPEIVEDIRVRCCVVTSSARAKVIKENPSGMEKIKSFKYELDGDNFVEFHGIVREKPAEIWFQNEDLDGISLPIMILRVLSNCPVDMRKTLASSILITGGTGMLTGLKGRLLKELSSLSKTPKALHDPVLQEKFKAEDYTFKIFNPPVQPNSTSWLGGAIYGATEAMSLRGVTKEFFLKHGLVPDWCDLHLDMVNALSSSGISEYGMTGSPKHTR